MTATAARPRTKSADAVAFSLSRADLLPALTHLSAINRASSLPVLQCVLVQANDGRVSLSYTDLDRLIETRLASAFPGECAVAIPLRRLLDVARGLPNDADVNFAINGVRVTVTSGRSRFEITGLGGDEFPQFETAKRSGVLSVAGSVLAGTVARVAAHVAGSDSAGEQHALRGLLLELPKEGQPHIVGANRHGMARVPFDVKQIEGGCAGDFLVPREALSALAKLFGHAGNVEVYGNNAKLVFDSGDVRYTVNLMNERFPPYRAMVNGFKPVMHVELSRAEFADAISRVLALADATVNRVEFTFAPTEVTLLSRAIDVGNGEDVIACAFARNDGTAEPFRIGFNARYVLDALDALDGERTRIDFVHADSVARFTDTAAPDGAFAMLAPLRLL